MNQIAKAGTSGKPTLYCSFCGKSHHEVAQLVAGPTVFICDECTLLCVDIMTAKEARLEAAIRELSDPLITFRSMGQIQFASVEELIRQAGIENPDRQISGNEVLAAMFTAFRAHRKANPKPEEVARKSAKAQALRATIAEREAAARENLAAELDPLRKELAALEGEG